MTTRRRILYLAHRIPYPPNKGDKIRSFHQVRYLAERHDVWCAFFVDDASDLTHVDTLRNWCHDVAAIPISRFQSVSRGAVGLAIGGSLTDHYFRDRRMRRTIRNWSESIQFDAALVFSSGMASYRTVINARRRVLDLCDWDSLKWKSYADAGRSPFAPVYRLESKRLAKLELRWLNEFDACTVISQAEVDAMDLPSQCARPHVIGNGVDVAATEQTTANANPTNIGFVGQMDYKPNVDAVRWFADHVLPRIREHVRDAHFEIVGRQPTHEVRALANRPGITVTGEVDDVHFRLLTQTVNVAPLRLGQGVQNKVLEAMAASRPVVLTRNAASGIDAVDRRDFVIAEAAEDFADEVVSLLGDPARRAELGAAARNHVETRHRWEEPLAKLEALLLGS